VAKKVPEQAAPGSVVLLSGLTSQMDAADPRSFEGLQEMIGGIKRCLERPPTWVVATSPVARGSVFKPVGGNNLLHFAGCIVAVTRRQQSETTTVTEYRLVKHPQAPERVTKEFFTKQKAWKRKRIFCWTLIIPIIGDRIPTTNDFLHFTPGITLGRFIAYGIGFSMLFLRIIIQSKLVLKERVPERIKRTCLIGTFAVPLYLLVSFFPGSIAMIFLYPGGICTMLIGESFFITTFIASRYIFQDAK